MREFWIHLFHIILVGGLLFYIGYVRKLPAFMYPIVLGLGVLIFGYHIYKSVYKKDAWVNYIHIFIVAPLLVYVGVYKDQTPRKVFELILMLAFAAIGYHLVYLMQTPTEIKLKKS